jgi:hypothetical protein
MERAGVRINTTYLPRLLDAATGTLIETITMVVDDHGEGRVIMDESETVIILREELASMVDRKGLRVIRWFDHESGEPLAGSNNLNYLVLKRE